MKNEGITLSCDHPGTFFKIDSAINFFHDDKEFTPGCGKCTHQKKCNYSFKAKEVKK